MKADPKKDGIDHINVYSQGQTELGRLLSNFAHTPFTCSDGKFESVEGYWYWLLSKHPERDRLRSLHGFMAKQVGRELITDRSETDSNHQGFHEKIYNAYAAKLASNPRVKELLKASELPFKHYYVYSGKVVPVEQYDWLMTYWESLRSDLYDGN